MTAFLDTGVLYGALDLSDEHHMDALSLVFHGLKGRWGGVYTSNYVELEATLLLGSRLGRAAARALPAFLGRSGFKELHVDEGTHKKAVELFSKDEKLSVTDASSVLLAGVVGARTMLTFDGRSFAGKPFEVLGRRYWEGMDDEERGEVSAWIRKAEAKEDRQGPEI